MVSFANSEDADEMQHKATFHQVYTVCRGNKELQVNKIQYFLKIITRHP